MWRHSCLIPILFDNCYKPVVFLVTAASLHACTIYTKNCTYSQNTTWRWIEYPVETCRGIYQNKIKNCISLVLIYTLCDDIWTDYRVWRPSMWKHVRDFLTVARVSKLIWNEMLRGNARLDYVWLANALVTLVRRFIFMEFVSLHAAD